MLAPLALVLPALASAAAGSAPDSVTYDARLMGTVAYAHNQSYEGGGATDEKIVSFRLDALLEGVTFANGAISRGVTSQTIGIYDASASSRHVTDVGQTVITCRSDGDGRSQGFASLGIAPLVGERVNLDPSWLNLTPYTRVAIPATCTDNQGGAPTAADLGLSNSSSQQDARSPFSWQFQLDRGRVGEQQLSWKANRTVPAAACPERSEATTSCQATFKGTFVMNRVADEQLAPAAVVAPSAAVGGGARTITARARCRRKPACAMEVWIFVPPKRGSGRRGSLRSGMSIRPLAHRTLSLRAGGGWSTLTVPLGAAAQRTAKDAGTLQVVVEASAPKAKTVKRTLTVEVG